MVLRGLAKQSLTKSSDWWEVSTGIDVSASHTRES